MRGETERSIHIQPSGSRAYVEEKVTYSSNKKKFLIATDY